LAGELKDDNIGCNTLWPRTSIATAAVMNLLGGEKVVSASRTPDIMADAAYIVMTSKSSETTDNFFLVRFASPLQTKITNGFRMTKC